MTPYRIMVVDDEEDVRSIISATLRPHYEIVEAHDGLDALEKLERYEPDFILMDVMMPLMDGLQACEAIRKNSEFRDVPVMFLSALGSKDDIKKGYSSGANLYLTKPFEPSRLLRNVQVFFETTPPRRRQKKFTYEQLMAAPEPAPAAPPPGSLHDLETISDADVEAETPPEPAPVPAPPEGVPRIMIVEDDEEVIELMSMVLGDQYEITYATDGLQAIERVVRHQPDVLVIDIMLPKMSGFQLCQSMRSNQSFSHTPILVCSAKCTDRDMAYAKRMGADDFLPKPFQSADLLEKVEALTRLPKFKLRPKAIPIQQIKHEIMPTAEEDVFEADSEARRAEAAFGAAPNTEKAVRQFLHKERGKEAFERKDAEEKEKKKKKRFFGFGRKK